MKAKSPQLAQKKMTSNKSLSNSKVLKSSHPTVEVESTVKHLASQNSVLNKQILKSEFQHEEVGGTKSELHDNPMNETGFLIADQTTVRTKSRQSRRADLIS